MSDPDAVANPDALETAEADAAPGGGLTGRQIQRLAMSGSMWTALHAITSVPIAFVANAVVARSLGVVDYGSLAFLTIAFTLATQISNAGFSDSTIRAGSAAEARGDGGLVDALLRRSTGFHLSAEMPLLWLVSLWLARDESVVVVVALLASVTITCLFGTATLALSIENRSAVAARIAMASNLALQVGVAVTAVVTLSPIAVVAARLLLSAAFVPVNLVALRPERRRAVLRPLLPRGLPAGFWRFAAQSFVAGLLALLVYSRSEIFLLDWLSTAESVGLFALAFGLSYQITAPIDAMLNPLAPAVSGLVSAHPDLARRAFLRALRFAAVLSALVTAVLLPVVYFAVPVVYGGAFRGAADLLLPLALASCVQSMAAPVTAFVFGREQGGRLLRAHAIALVVNVGLSVVLIAWVGVWGAVTANVAGQLASIAVLSRGELAEHGLSVGAYLWVMRLWPASVVVGGVAVAVGLVAEAAGVPLLVCAAGSGAVGAVLVVLAVRVGRAGLDPEDGDALVDAVPGPVRAVARGVTAVMVRGGGSAVDHEPSRGSA